MEVDLSHCSASLGSGEEFWMDFVREVSCCLVALAVLTMDLAPEKW